MEILRDPLGNDDPPRGSVFLDGTDICDITLRDMLDQRGEI